MWKKKKNQSNPLQSNQQTKNNHRGWRAFEKLLLFWKCPWVPSIEEGMTRNLGSILLWKKKCAQLISICLHSCTSRRKRSQTYCCVIQGCTIFVPALQTKRRAVIYQSKWRCRLRGSFMLRPSAKYRWSNQARTLFKLWQFQRVVLWKNVTLHLAGNAGILVLNCCLTHLTKLQSVLRFFGTTMKLLLSFNKGWMKPLQQIQGVTLRSCCCLDAAVLAFSLFSSFFFCPLEGAFVRWRHDFTIPPGCGKAIHRGKVFL